MLEKIKDLVDLEDPISVIKKADTVVGLLGKGRAKELGKQMQNPVGKGGLDRLEELKQKRDNGGLSPREEKEIVRLAIAQRKK